MRTEWKEISNAADNDVDITIQTRKFITIISLSKCTFSEHGGRERRDALDNVDRYDREDPCNGMKQILTGFRKWSDRYISECSGQRTMQHQKKRMEKWGGIMNSVTGYNFLSLYHMKFIT